MIDICFILIWLFAFYGLGAGFHSLLGLPGKNALPLRPLLGAAFAVPFAIVCYIAGLSASAICILILLLAAGGWILHLFRARKAASRIGLRLLKVRAPLFLLWAGVLLLLIAPRLNGGLQFSVYQANRWDTFSYLDSASGFANYSYSQVRDSGPEAERHLTEARGILYSRPGIMIFYAVCSRLFPSSMWTLSYAFLMVFVFLEMLAITALLVWLFKASVFRSALAGAAFVLGFWGQYSVDINAWSQLTSAPFFALMAASMIRTFNMRSPGIRDLAPVVFTASASVYIYPEAFLVMAFCVGAALTILYVFYRSRRNLAYFTTAAAAVAGLATSILFYKGTLGFAFHQYFGTTSLSVDWWKEYQAFLVGRDGIALGKEVLSIPLREVFSRMPFLALISEAIDILSGFFGFYLITPGPEAGPLSKALVRISLLLLAVGLVVALGPVWKHLRKKEGGRLQALAVLLLLACLGMVVLVLAANRSFWAAGKTVSYASPYFVAILLLPFVLQRRISSPTFVPAVLYLVLCAAFGFYRVHAAALNQGEHYPRPYPVADSEVKTGHDWNLSRFDAALEKCDVVTVDAQNDFYRRFAFLYLRSAGKPYYEAPGKPGAGDLSRGGRACTLTETEVRVD